MKFFWIWWFFFSPPKSTWDSILLFLSLTLSDVFPPRNWIYVESNVNLRFCSCKKAGIFMKMNNLLYVRIIRSFEIISHLSAHPYGDGRKNTTQIFPEVILDWISSWDLYTFRSKCGNRGTSISWITCNFLDTQWLLITNQTISR